MFRRICRFLQPIAFAYIALQVGMLGGAGDFDDPNKVWATFFALIGLIVGIGLQVGLAKWVMPWILKFRPSKIRLAMSLFVPTVLLILLAIGVYSGRYWASIHHLRREIGIGLGFVLFLLVADTFWQDFTGRIIYGMLFVVALMIANEILLVLHPHFTIRLLREPKVFGCMAFSFIVPIVLVLSYINNWPTVRGWLRKLWQLSLAAPQPGAKGAKPPHNNC